MMRHPAFAVLVFSAVLSAASFLVIALCRLWNLPSGTVPAMVLTIVLDRVPAEIEQRAVAAFDSGAPVS